VGITRARRRLHLIANGSAVMRSRHGPLLTVRKLQEPHHLELAAQFPSTVHIDKEHQKIIMIDQHPTFIGSMNALAHPQGGRH
jgi:hypothetical protein